MSVLITAAKDVDADPGLRSGRLCAGMTDAGRGSSTKTVHHYSAACA